MTDLTSTEFEDTPGLQDWRALARGVSAWFDAPSMSAGAALVAELEADGVLAEAAVDIAVRPQGVRVVIRTERGISAAAAAAARRISEIAADRGLTAEPRRLCDVQLTIDVTDPDQVAPFWAAALGYERLGDEDLVDPLRRQPPIWLQDSDHARPLRNRIHVDVSRAALGDAGTQAELLALSGSGELGGAYGVCLADREGNEVDVVPPGDDWDRQELADWVLMFGAMAHYPVTSSEGVALVVAAAELADSSGARLLVDLTPEGVTFDSGKDGWEMDDRFPALAEALQAAARGRGLVADADPLRFVQIGIDAVDVDAVRDVWRAVLRYVDDPRRDRGVSDIVDPLRLGPPVFFQDMDADDAARRDQRNRIHVDIYVPADEARARIDAALAAGGRVVRDAEEPFWVTIADPEGNEIDIAVIRGREEVWG